MIFSLTIVEAIILFMIDTYRSTFLCFLELVVRGALAVLIGAVQTMSDFITSTFNGIRTSIQNDVATANNVIQAAVSGINKVTSLVHVNLNVPQFSIPSLDALNNVTLPTGFEDALLQLNSSLPTLDQLRNALDAVIEKPFDAVKADINNTFSAIQFNSSVLNVPTQNTLAFCSGMDLSVVDSLGRDIVKIARAAAALLVLAALLLVGVNCVIQWWRWRRLQDHLENIRMAWRSDPMVSDVPEFEMTNHNLMLLINTAEHPLLSRIANHITRAFGLSHSQHVNLRFFASYVFYPPALACLLIGVLGILSVELQLAALGPLQKHYHAQVNSTVNNFSNQIALAINSGMTNQSTIYATQVNTHMLDVQNQINNNVFGWVNTTTTALNDTLVAFYDELQSAVNSTLGGTVLASPAQEFLRCMIGTKIQSLEAALTFLHDNLQVNMPLTRLRSQLPWLPSEPPSNSTSNLTSGNEQGVVGKVITRYIVSLKKQRILFAIFLGLWLFVVLIALLIICWHAYGFEVWEEHKRRRFQKEKDGLITPWFHLSRQRSGERPLHPASLAAPPHHSTSVIAEAKERRVEGAPYGEEERSTTDEHDLHSFTPLATPKRSIFSAVLPSSRGINDGTRYPTLQSLFAEDSNARVDPKDLHPLSRTNPRFQQSWDSHLDARKMADPEKDARNKGSSATWNRAKLRNDSRRLTKQDPFEYRSPGDDSSPAVMLTDLVLAVEPYDVPQDSQNPWTSGWATESPQRSRVLEGEGVTS
ncbi:hypothetical protein BS47DRAFT_1382798 [Hydnum rufescens UP504]|uniref:Plasma membrane fusion protein PRM1 n=1 Tax=Hydnum rufescens UP504 TaxID=1448309 RepID=A0A9P6DVK5_9AGAM|nr:hypothetical protein BS47DRAFT_1382798 [Hydnum rufescens UP504]